MFCDACFLSLPFSISFENQKLENLNASGDKLITVSGRMPKDTKLSINEIGKEEANSLTNNLANSDIEIKSIENAYDISLLYNEKDYQPADYNNQVKVKLSNLNLDSDKTYALLHIKDDGFYEVIPSKVLNNNELEFTAKGFSMYVVITVDTNTITFSGDNFKVYNTSGAELTDGLKIPEGTNLSLNVVPNDGYGIAEVTSNGVISSSDTVIGKTISFESVTEDLTVDVTTVLAPVITTQPVSLKISEDETATFSVVADNATTYYWEYRENSDANWQAAGSTSETLSISSDNLKTGEYRCLVGNEYFVGNERIKSDVATLSIVDSNNTKEVQYLKLEITSQPQPQKVKIGEIATFTIETNGVDTYNWQYKPSGETTWLDASAIGTGYDTNTLKIDTSSVTLDENLNVSGNLVGAYFRCVVSNSTASRITKNSDITVLSIAQDEQILDNIEINPDIASDVKLYANNEIYSGDRFVNQIVAVLEIQRSDTTWIQYKISEVGEWTSDGAQITINNGTATIVIEQEFIEDKVYFREINVEGQSITSTQTKGYMYKQEKEPPTVKNMKYETIDKQIIIEALLEDKYEIAEYAIAEIDVTPKVWYKAYGKEITSGDETITLDTTAVNISSNVKGSNTYVIWAKDKAGNISSNTIKVVKDIQPPKAEIEIKDAKEVDGELYVNTEEIVLLIDVSDNVSEPEEIKMAIFNEADYKALEDKTLIEWEPYSNKKTWLTEPGDGPKHIYILLKDKAGNISPKEVEYK